MLRYYYIRKEWMLSGSAQLIYRLSAILSLVLFFLLIILNRSLDVDPRLLPMVRLLLFAGVLGTAITIVAMEYFLFGFDNSTPGKKAFWFCAMLLPPLGPALYCLIVYLRSDLLTKADPHRNELHP
jgi:hypothetical protein